MTALDHLRIAITGGILLATLAEIAWQLYHRRDDSAAALASQEDHTW